MDQLHADNAEPPGPSFKPRPCKHCQTIFTPTGPAGRFCSVTCKRKGAWQRERLQRERDGKPMKSHGGNHSGKTGAEHHAYKTGIGMFSQRLSKEYRARVRFCEHCSKDLADAPRAFWCVHHKDHDRTNNQDSNFELLCKRCHQIEHKCWESFTKRDRTEQSEQCKDSCLKTEGGAASERWPALKKE